MSNAKKVTPKRSKAAKVQPKKLKKMSQTHGKEEKFEPTTLDQIWGDTGAARYGTMDEQEYLTRLSTMHVSDLRIHAGDLGLIPVDDRTLLEKRLLSEFRKHVNQYRMPLDQGGGPEEIPENVRKILEEGK